MSTKLVKSKTAGKTRVKYPATITKEAFQKMSSIAKRKALGREVMFRLDQAKQITPTSGIYCEITAVPKKFFEGLVNEQGERVTDAQAVLLNENVNCEICAIGGAIIGISAIEDRINMREGFGRSGIISYSGSTYQRVSEILGYPLSHKIEDYFEDDQYYSTEKESVKTSRRRFREIWTQIAKTGKFKAPKE